MALIAPGFCMKGCLVVAASVVLQACLGGIYAWSAFVPPLRQAHGYSSSQTQLVFGTAFLVFTTSAIVTGRLLDKYGPRRLAVASGLLLTAGHLLASASGSNFGVLWLGYGVIFGLAIGCGYICPIATSVKWFPRHKGLVSGLAVAGYGGGAIVLANVANTLLARGWDPLEILRLVAFVYGPIIVLAGLLLFTPAAPPRQAVRRFRRRELLRNRQFWAICLGMFCGTLPGLVIIGNLKPMGLAFGVGEMLATQAIALYSLGSAIGRIGWGFVHDALGGRPAILLALSLIAASIAGIAVAGAAGSGWGFVVASVFVGLCYGSSFALYPARVADLWGPAVLGSVYSLVLLWHGLAGLAGPWLGGAGVDLVRRCWPGAGEPAAYMPGLTLALAAATVGLAVYALLTRPARSPADVRPSDGK